MAGGELPREALPQAGGRVGAGAVRGREQIYGMPRERFGRRLETPIGGGVEVHPAEDGMDRLAPRQLRDVPERHRSMRAVLDHSWTLLTARERDAMQGLSVFRGGLVREAAQQITGVSLPELRTLINKSLLHLQPSGRYHLHELVRQYAAERLAQSPTASKAAVGRHCAWYTAALQRWVTDMKGPQQQDVLAEMDAEIENARAAWDWAVEHILIHQLDLALDGLCAYYQRRGRLEEGQTACRSVVEKLQDPASVGEMITPPSPAQLEAWPDERERQRLLAKALTWQGVFVRSMGYAGPAGPILERSIALLDALESVDQDVRAERAFALLEMGRQAFDLDRVRAKRCLEQSLDLYQALEDRWGVADTLYTLGWLADGLGRASGPLYPVVAPFIGLLGAFMTGSNTNSNVVFAPLQQQAAQLLHISVPVILGAQTTGGSLGSMLAPAKLIVGCSTAGLAGQEGRVLKRTLLPGLIITAMVGLLAWLAISLGWG